jgi:hypothetical protein
MESWLGAHGIKAVERPKWRVPTADEVQKEVTEAELEKPGRRTRAVQADAIRTKIHELIDTLPARELDAALAYLDYLRERRHLPRAAQKSLGPKRPGDDSAPFDPNEPEPEGDDRDDVDASESDEA